jgi:hypothetical protein
LKAEQESDYSNMAKTNSLNSDIRGKANSGNRERRRPPNKFCRHCGRKKVYPEKYCGEWGYPGKQTCFDCIMLRDGEIGYTNEEKSRDKDNKEQEERENALKFPLTILDTTNDIFVGQYNSRRKTQQAINRYQIRRRTKALEKKISVLHHATDYSSDFTDLFRNTG